MKQIKAFLYIASKSVSSLKYYQDVVNSNTKMTIKYFIILGIFGAVLNTVLISIKTVPQVQSSLNNILEQIENLYPEDLSVTFTKGEWTINKEEPYTISFPENLHQGFNSQKENEDNNQQEGKFPRNLIFIDHNSTIDDLEKHDTLIVMNAKNLIFKESSGIKVTPLKDFPDTVLDRTKFMQILNDLRSILMIFPAILVIIIFLLLVTSNLGLGMIYTLIVASILWILSNFMTEKMKFPALFKISVHTMTFPIILQILIGTIDLALHLLNIKYPMDLSPGIYLISNIVFGSIVMMYLVKKNGQQTQ